jgi:hypothetical protein
MRRLDITGICSAALDDPFSRNVICRTNSFLESTGSIDQNLESDVVACGGHTA